MQNHVEPAGTGGPEGPFASVLTGEPDWVRAEFEALMAANFPDWHGTARKRPRRHRSSRRVCPMYPADARTGEPAGLPLVRTGGHGRGMPRSPPEFWRAGVNRTRRACSDLLSPVGVGGR